MLSTMPRCCMLYSTSSSPTVYRFILFLHYSTLRSIHRPNFSTYYPLVPRYPDKKRRCSIGTVQVLLRMCSISTQPPAVPPPYYGRDAVAKVRYGRHPMYTTYSMYCIFPFVESRASHPGTVYCPQHARDKAHAHHAHHAHAQTAAPSG